MAMSSLTYILVFSVKFFFQPIYTDYAQKFELKWSLGGPLSKLWVRPHFLSTLDVKLKTRWAITGSWEPLVNVLWFLTLHIQKKSTTVCQNLHVPILIQCARIYIYSYNVPEFTCTYVLIYITLFFCGRLVVFIILKVLRWVSFTSQK